MKLNIQFRIAILAAHMLSLSQLMYVYRIPFFFIYIFFDTKNENTTGGFEFYFCIYYKYIKRMRYGESTDATSSVAKSLNIVSFVIFLIKIFK